VEVSATALAAALEAVQAGITVVTEAVRRRTDHVDRGPPEVTAKRHARPLKSLSGSAFARASGQSNKGIARAAAVSTQTSQV